jgi:hypothetical protein
VADLTFLGYDTATFFWLFQDFSCCELWRESGSGILRHSVRLVPPRETEMRPDIKVS